MPHPISASPSELNQRVSELERVTRALDRPRRERFGASTLPIGIGVSGDTSLEGVIRVASFSVVTPQAIHGHQGGILIDFADAAGDPANTFVATHEDMVIDFDIAASVLGSATMLLTFAMGIIDPPGDRIQDDSVFEEAMPGVTDFRQIIGFMMFDVEQIAAPQHRRLSVAGLTVGATYTFEVQWGHLSGYKVIPMGTGVGRCAVEALSQLYYVCCNSTENTVSICDLGAMYWWQREPGQEQLKRDVNPYFSYERVTIPLAGFGPLGVDMLLGNALISCTFSSTIEQVNVLQRVRYNPSGVIGGLLTDVAWSPTDPAVGYVGSLNGFVYKLAVSPAAIGVTASVNTGSPVASIAVNLNGATPQLWAGCQDGVVRVYNATTLAAINSLNLASGGISRVYRQRPINSSGVAPPGDVAETIFVACVNFVHHVNRGGTAVLGSMDVQATAGEASVCLDCASSSDGQFLYIAHRGASGGTDQMSYFWMPNDRDQGPAYDRFDGNVPVQALTPDPNAYNISSMVSASDEYVLNHITNRSTNVSFVTMWPAGLGTIRPSGATTNSEHASMTVYGVVV